MGPLAPTATAVDGISRSNPVKKSGLAKSTVPKLQRHNIFEPAPYVSTRTAC